MRTIHVALSLIVLAVGCGARPVNPSFPTTVLEARNALEGMRADPKPLQRPLVLLGGYHDPGVGVGVVSRELKGLFDDPQIIGVSFTGCDDFDECRQRVIDAVERAFRSDDPEQTVEVDVIGVSMGGLVARHAAVAKQDGKRLNVRRLFTVSSPHRGAVRAGLPAMTQLHRDMRSESKFLAELAEHDLDYELIPYVRLGDWVVGAENAAPAGMTPWWVDNRRFEPAHAMSARDPRIIADIARRLRGEEPLTTWPPAPLPKEE